MAVLSSIGAFECKFVLATVPVESSEIPVESVKDKEASDDDYISGTEDEL